eukprot:7116873-Ditylum_brightwellii.AAC.1
MQDCLNKRIARIISNVNISTKKYHSTSSMTSVLSSRSLYETHKRNMDDQWKLPNGLFELSKQIQIFKHNFKVAMHGRSHWYQILKINTAKGVKGILTDFMLIEEDNLKGACIKCTPEEKFAVLNMFVALWKSFARHVKTTMQTIADKHECNGPALLYHLLWHYTSIAESVIRTSQDLLNTLPDKLDKLSFEIAKFCDYATKTLKMLTDAGDTDKQAPLKLYKAFVTSHNNSFNSETQVYKATIAAKSKALEFS